MAVALTYDGPVKAPIAKGQKIGTLSVTAPEYPGLTVPVYAAEDVGSAGFVSRIFLGLRSLVSGHGTAR